jgi:hypothetical protein
LEEHVSIFMAEEAENSSKMLVTTCKATWLFYPEDGASMLLQNVHYELPHYMASHPIRQSPLWEFQILQHRPWAEDIYSPDQEIYCYRIEQLITVTKKSWISSIQFPECSVLFKKNAG